MNSNQAVISVDTFNPSILTLTKLKKISLLPFKEAVSLFCALTNITNLKSSYFTDAKISLWPVMSEGWRLEELIYLIEQENKSRIALHV